MEKLGIKTKNLFIFDLDGTLVDSKNQISQAVALARHDSSFPDADPEFLESKIGLAAFELFSDLTLTDDERHEIVKVFRSYLMEIRLNPCDLFPGSNEVLTLLKAAKFRLAVATNKPSILAEKALFQTGIVDLIDFVAGGEILPQKPDPAIVLHAIKGARATAEKSIMIGDRIEDMQAAKSAGINCIGVTQGVHSAIDLLSSGAQQVFDSMEKLFVKLEKGWNFENF